MEKRVFFLVSQKAVTIILIKAKKREMESIAMINIVIIGVDVVWLGIEWKTSILKCASLFCCLPKNSTQSHTSYKANLFRIKSSYCVFPLFITLLLLPLHDALFSLASLFSSQFLSKKSSFSAGLRLCVWKKACKRFGEIELSFRNLSFF